MKNSNIPEKLAEFSVSGRGLTSGGKRVLQAIFTGVGIRPEELVIWDYKKHFRISCYGLSGLRERRIIKQLRFFRVKKIKVRDKILKPEDWFYKWQESYRIMPAGKKFVIVPAWKKIPRLRKGKSAVILDPGSAFGTGGHETTQLMIRAMEILEGKFADFLDVGTGSGVLAVVASRLGAKYIDAFDHDAMSVRIAEKNFKMNNCANGCFFRASLRKNSSRCRYDLVGANLLSKTLLHYKKQILARVKPEGYLIVSGIAKRHFPDFRTKFEMPKLLGIKMLLGRSWAAAIYRKCNT